MHELVRIYAQVYYRFGMAAQIPHVETSADARAQLSSVLKRFRRDGAAAEPLIFGSHRKPEGVVIPYVLYERLVTILEDRELAVEARERLAAGQGSSMDLLFEEFGVEIPR